MLKVGDPAPDIQLHTDTDEDFRLSQMKGKRVVLYFYPRATVRRAFCGDFSSLLTSMLSLIHI